MKKGILFVNLGTIDICNKKILSKYLREFLMDERVIDISYWKRWLLVNAIIVPFRTPKVIKEYQKLFTPEGSPLLIHSKKLALSVQENLGDNYVVELAMRYRNPSIQTALYRLQKQQVDEIIIFPLFPQYASATIGSIHQQVMKIISSWHVIPHIQFVSSFYQNPLYLNCYAESIKKHTNVCSNFHLLFSYHGIPQRHIEYTKQQGLGSEGGNHTNYNYQSACFHHSDLLAELLGIEKQNYTTCFQSRLGKDPWIQPYTADVIVNLAQNECQNLIVCAPSFVADCLETTLEIGEQYRDLFIAHGGKSFKLVESLNSTENWANTLAQMIRERC